MLSLLVFRSRAPVNMLATIHKDTLCSAYYLTTAMSGQWFILQQVKKVYLIQITELVPRRLDLETVWMLDSESRSVQKAAVEQLTDLDDPTELVLRIRYTHVHTVCKSVFFEACPLIQRCCPSACYLWTPP